MDNSGELSLSRSEVRAIDAAAVDELGITGLMLMENAARGVCDILLQHFAIRNRPGQPTLIVCGPGNNGGDGLALARQLLAMELPVDVQLVRGGKSLSHDAEQNLSILNRAGIEVSDVTSQGLLETRLAKLSTDDVLVDCLLGTGVKGSPREPFCSTICAINSSPAQVLAVDVPSGLDCELGVAEGECVCAIRTVTFMGMKSGFLLDSAKKFTGEISVAHIGLPFSWVSDWLDAKRHQERQ